MNSSFIVGDAGGTGTQWRIVKDGNISQAKTVGFNAYTHDIEVLKKDIIETVVPLGRDSSKIFFYAAGVDIDEQKQEAKLQLQSVFEGEVYVENDLLGAAKSLCGIDPGYIGIIGTGSNACVYDGKKVDKVSASLGYILGDEGSGAYLGKLLLKKIFRSQIDKAVIQSFQDKFNMTSHDVITKLYNEEMPNHFLASFALFMSEHKSRPEVYQLIQQSFHDYLTAFFPNIEGNIPLHFSGSIAFYFSDILRQVCQDKGFAVGNIVESPISGLVLYHQNYE